MFPHFIVEFLSASRSRLRHASDAKFFALFKILLIGYRLVSKRSLVWLLLLLELTSYL